MKNIEIINKGLAEFNGKLLFGLPKERLNKHGYTKVVAPDEKKFGIQIIQEAVVDTPDNILSKFQKINYIKCDIEGYENRVLPLLLGILKRHKPILQIELARENCSLAIKKLTGIGYYPFTLQKNILIKVTPENLEECCDVDFIFLHKSTTGRIGKDKTYNIDQILYS